MEDKDVCLRPVILHSVPVLRVKQIVLLILKEVSMLPLLLVDLIDGLENHLVSISIPS
jgi:hypothetical protein